ncbi:MAG: hypothetical protein FRX49_11112 [Trebouxia sp. A1-2]|nr:MAG: hypothetical protein FRX49_11112 [Trebouxia sp. A1-2]
MVLIQCVYISPPCFRVFAQELAEFGNISLLTEESVKRLRHAVCGSKASVHAPKQLRRKLDPLSTAGIFIGHEPNFKASRVLMDSGQMQTLKYVIFLERVPKQQLLQKLNTPTMSPSTVQEDNSEGDSTGIDLGPTYFTDWKIEEAATQAATEQAEPAAEDTAATSAQEREAKYS